MTIRVATARWRRIETLFHQASDVDPSQRDAFLDRACEGDAEMRAELDSLLSSSDRTLTELKLSVSSTAVEMLDAGDDARNRLGAYRLIRTLGEGGMGAVYLAARDDDQYERLVAIKLLRAGLAHSPALQLRFRTERQILANLDHPNIARLLDGGISADGAPYLVMEYIDGSALDVFCDQQKLSLDARLRLFRTLCAAVDYAHRHLVIHRDIKPLNVLVLQDGTPKLLDFGIAKLIDPYQPGFDPAITRGSERLLTPDYASPEQLLGKPVSTSTDVYALGVLLYELLAGELPFAAAGSEPMKHAHAICEQEPEKPSARCLRTGHLPAAEARRLRGDLDSIILKALRKQPEQRYANASQLLTEIDRYLSGYAVDAAEQTVAYRVKKFVLRHRAGVTLGTLLAILILVFGIGMAVLARRATRGEARARREQEFLASIFAAATPEGSKGENVTARQLLDRAAARIDAELASDPQLQASMSESVGQSYVALGLYDKAQPLLERAVAITRDTEGERSADYAGYLNNLATNYRLRSEYQKAEPLFRRAVALNEAAHGANSPEVAHSLTNLGECLYLLEKDGEAEQILRRALAIERPLPDDQQDANRDYLALVLERKGAYPEAASLLREATAIDGRVHGKQSQDYLVSLHNLAGAQIDMGDLDGAAKTEQEVLATRQQVWGLDHPDTAYSLNNLGWIYLEQGRWQDAEPLLRQNADIMRKMGPDAGPRYPSALGNWGRVLQQKGDFDGAASAFDQAQYLLAVDGRGQSWLAAKLLVYQSALELDRGHAVDALRSAEKAVRMQKELGGDNNAQLASGLLELGLSQLIAGNPAAADLSFRAALAIRQRLYPMTHPDLLIAQVRLAEALLSERRPQEAMALLDQAIANADAAPFPLLPWRLAELRVVEGLAMLAAGRESEGFDLISANTAALQGYNQLSVRNYLNSQITAFEHSR
jgi:serine/threonine protein kinase/Tfp pilus assembly protein PilF